MKDGQSVSSGSSADMLRIGSVTKEDQGMYQCFIGNDYDSAQSTGELRLGGEKYIPYLLRSSKIFTSYICAHNYLHTALKP